MGDNIGMNVILGNGDGVKLESCKPVMKRLTIVDKIKTEWNSILNKPQQYLHYDEKKRKIFIVREIINR
jgi:hypothetical protein